MGHKKLECYYRNNGNSLDTFEQKNVMNCFVLETVVYCLTGDSGKNRVN